MGGEVEATTAEILGCLQKYATIERLHLPLTLQLGGLKRKLRDQLRRLDRRRTYNGNVTDRNDCDGLNQWVATFCEEALGDTGGSKGGKAPDQARGG